MFVYYPVCFCNDKPMVRVKNKPGFWRCLECDAIRDDDPDKAGAWRIIKVSDRRPLPCGT